MPDDTPQPHWTLAALLRAPASAEDIARLVAQVRALAAATKTMHVHNPARFDDADTARAQAPDDGHERPSRP